MWRPIWTGYGFWPLCSEQGSLSETGSESILLKFNRVRLNLLDDRRPSNMVCVKKSAKIVADILLRRAILGLSFCP